MHAHTYRTQQVSRLVMAFVLLFSCQVTASPTQIEHYTIWIKAFIPNSDLDVVSPVPGNPSSWMIPGPPMTDCYNTNNRGFSDSINADAKITAAIDFDVSSAGVANVHKHDVMIGETIKYDCNTGHELARDTSHAAKITIGDPAYDRGIITFVIDGEASNPLVKAAALLPIRLHGILKLDTNARAIGFEGMVARFPSYEAYVQLNDGNPIAVFQVAPSRDATPWSLAQSLSLNVMVPYETAQ